MMRLSLLWRSGLVDRNGYGGLAVMAAEVNRERGVDNHNGHSDAFTRN